MHQCCYKCFVDDFLVAKIKNDGLVQECSLCRGTAKCLDIQMLRDLFLPLVHLYAKAEEFLPMEYLKGQAGEGPFLVDQIDADWGVFKDLERSLKFFELCHGLSDPRDNDDFFDPYRSALKEDLFFHGEPEKSLILSTAWAELTQELQEENRFFAGRNVVSDIKNALNSELVKINFKADTLFRVRSTSKDEPYRTKNMGAPPADKSTAGRANPAGIPYLYLASDQNTAICEVRPHNNERLTVGSFKLSVNTVNCVDLREPRIKSPFRHGKHLSDVVGVLGFLRRLGYELSLPIGNQRRDFEYLPTQYLCELIKNLGYEGVLYNSGLSDGYNVALFNPNAAYCFETKLVRVRNIHIDVEDISNL